MGPPPLNRLDRMSRLENDSHALVLVLFGSLFWSVTPPEIMPTPKQHGKWVEDGRAMVVDKTSSGTWNVGPGSPPFGQLNPPETLQIETLTHMRVRASTMMLGMEVFTMGVNGCPQRPRRPGMGR